MPHWTNRELINKLNREVNYLQDQVLPVEHKYLTYDVNTFFSDGSYHNLADAAYECHSMLGTILTGDDYQSRTGDTIKLQNVTVRGAIYFPIEGIAGSQTAMDWQATCRLVFFTVPIWDDGAKYTNFATGGTYQQFYDTDVINEINPKGPFHAKNRETRYNTNIVKEIICSVSEFNPVYHFDFNMPLNMKVKYGDASITNGQPINNQLCYSIISDRTAYGGAQLDRCPILRMNYRLSWTDA